jgi:hypothetical protein
MVGRTTLFTPVDINLQQVVDFLNFYACIVMGDTIEKVSKSSILTKVSILSILAKSIGNSIPLEPAMFLVSIAEQSLNTS